MLFTMSTKKIVLEIKLEGPILHGCISTASSRCGTENCICKAAKPKLHGPYYRWTGFINGKRTTKTISKEVAAECEKRIKNYQNLLKKVDKLLKDAILNAPWEE